LQLRRGAAGYRASDLVPCAPELAKPALHPKGRYRYGKRTLATLASLLRHRDRSNDLGLIARSERRRADSLDDAKAAFRAAWGALG